VDEPRVVAELAGGILQVCLDDHSSEARLQQALALAIFFFRTAYRVSTLTVPGEYSFRTG